LFDHRNFETLRCMTVLRKPRQERVERAGEAVHRSWLPPRLNSDQHERLQTCCGYLARTTRITTVRPPRVTVTLQRLRGDACDVLFLFQELIEQNGQVSHSTRPLRLWQLPAKC